MKFKTFYSFKDEQAFQTFLRTQEWKEGELDYVTFGGKVYTMHEFDNDGQQITWANKKHNLMLEVVTSNRYRNGWGDAVVYAYEASGLRTDISYAQ